MVFDYQYGDFQKRDLVIENTSEDVCRFAAEETDISGLYVVPGLFDFHTHVGNRGILPYDPDTFCPGTGVTEVQDCGSYGTDQIDRFAEEIAKNSGVKIHVLLHVAREGQAEPSKLEDQRPESICEDRLQEACRRHKDLIRGFKIRLEQPMIDDGYASDTVFKTCDFAEKLGGNRYAVMVHLGSINDMDKLQEVLSILRPGDIVTHIYQPKVSGFTDAKSGIYESLRKAQERGVLLDTGFGSRQWSFETLRNAQAAGIVPDRISSDCNATNIILQPAVSMLYAGMVLHTAGMSWQEYFGKACIDNRSSLDANPYKAGDFFIFKLEPANGILTDATGEKAQISELIIPMMTYIRNQQVYEYGE